MRVGLPRRSQLAVNVGTKGDIVDFKRDIALPRTGGPFPGAKKKYVLGLRSGSRFFSVVALSLLVR